MGGRGSWAAGLTAVVLATAVCRGAEHEWDFTREKVGQGPAGFRSALCGEGQPGEWRILEVPLASAASAPAGVGAPAFVPREAVLAQVSTDGTEERFPLLIWEGDTFKDFTFTARVRTMEGQREQMAGLAFRIADERNYYVLRVSSLGNTVRFYKFVDGVRSAPIGPELPVERGVWHELLVDCRGNQIRCQFNGRDLFPPLTDNSFTDGRVGFWTKSDAVSQFKEARIRYTPREPLARRLVRQAMEDYGRLIAIKIYAASPGVDEVRLVASSVEGEAGVAAGQVETEVARKGTLYYGKGKEDVSVVLPLRDRNGDAVAAVRVVMKRFPGQTQDNAFARARPIVERMSRQVGLLKDLFE